MNIKLLLITCALFSSHATLLFAQTTYQRELKQLTEQRDKALATAVQPINRNYQASLQQLLQRATQSKDTEAVIAIAEALKAIGVPTEVPATATAARSPDIRKYVGAWRESVAGGQFLVTRTLNADGSALEGTASGSSWKIAGNKLNIIKVNGEIDSFDLPLRSDKLSGIGPDGVHLILMKVK